VHEQQVVLAAEVTLSSPDFGHLEPMLSATPREIQQVGLDVELRIRLRLK